jgi:hypothetical protein
LLHVFLFSYECFFLCRCEFPISYIAHVHSLIVIWKNSTFKLSQQNLHRLTTNKNCLSTFTRFGNNTWILCCCMTKETTCHGDKKWNGFRNPKFFTKWLKLFQSMLMVNPCTIHWSSKVLHLDRRMALIHTNQQKTQETSKS